MAKLDVEGIKARIQAAQRDDLEQATYQWKLVINAQDRKRRFLMRRYQSLMAVRNTVEHIPLLQGLVEQQESGEIFHLTLDGFVAKFMLPEFYGVGLGKDHKSTQRGKHPPCWVTALLREPHVVQFFADEAQNEGYPHPTIDEFGNPCWGYEINPKTNRDMRHVGASVATAIRQGNARELVSLLKRYVQQDDPAATAGHKPDQRIASHLIRYATEVETMKGRTEVEPNATEQADPPKEADGPQDQADQEEAGANAPAGGLDEAIGREFVHQVQGQLADPAPAPAPDAGAEDE